jgi:hypothetical protein
MAKKLMTGKLPAGPHKLTLKGERNETRKQEKAESPAFEAAERKLGIEGRYSKKGGKKKGY